MINPNQKYQTRVCVYNNDLQFQKSICNLCGNYICCNYGYRINYNYQNLIVNRGRDYSDFCNIEYTNYINYDIYCYRF